MAVGRSTSERILAARGIGPIAGMVGATVLAASSVIASLAYRGTAGKGVSPLDHRVSEPGQMGVSDLAAFELVVVCEWLVLAGMIGWGFVTAVSWWRART